MYVYRNFSLSDSRAAAERRSKGRYGYDGLDRLTSVTLKNIEKAWKLSQITKVCTLTPPKSSSYFLFVFLTTYMPRSEDISHSSIPRCWIRTVCIFFIPFSTYNGDVHLILYQVTACRTISCLWSIRPPLCQPPASAEAEAGVAARDF